MESPLHHTQPDQNSDPQQRQASPSSHPQPQSSYTDHYSVQPTPYDDAPKQPPNGRFTEDWDASQRGSSIIDGPGAKVSNMQRAPSVTSYAAGDDQSLPVRGNTLRKKTSLRRGGGSMRRSSSRRSTRAGSVKSLVLQSASDPNEGHSAFFCPVPTTGAPTEVLSERFQVWRKVLKDLISYFREIQNHYESRSKALIKLGNASNNIATPSNFLKTAGIDDALQLLRNYNKQAVQEANKAREIEEDVILALTGLRSDLQQKIKEIKHLSGDFKNSVDKEMDNTGKAVSALADILDKSEIDSTNTTGKQDPFLLRLAVDRQVERQIDEENYLHQAYLNLEGSGRELESIVVGEIQKAYNAYAGILKREAENALNVVGDLRDGPISMPKDQEWDHFVSQEERVVDPAMPLRTPEQIHYPGQDHLAAQEIRAGLLERKSKYLKSYTAGWYVLSSTHLHEFKSADKGPTPIMSLYLPDQKVGSHSEEGSSSNKFILKGRQTGGMHRGHTWVFRAESYDTMLAWYEDIKALTEKSPEERSQFVRTHSRSLSRSSRRSARSASSDGLDDDDEEPFSGSESVTNPASQADVAPRRPQPGGRFPSDIQINTLRGLQASQSLSSVSSGNQGYPSGANVVATGGSASQDKTNHTGYGGTMEEMTSQAAIANQEAQYDGVNPYTSEPVYQQHHEGGSNYAAPALATSANSEAQNEPTELGNGGLASQPDHQATVAGTSSSIPPESQAFSSGDAIDGDNNTQAKNDGVDGNGLQSVPESEAAAHVSRTDTPIGELPVRSNRPDDDRTNSISNLEIPGGFPKNNAGESTPAAQQ